MMAGMAPSDRKSATKAGIHYGWIIVVIGFLVIFSCFGLARYSYAMLLPAMQAALALPYERMGFIGTGNFTGYLLAVLLAPKVMQRLKPRWTIAGGLLLVGICMSAIAFTHRFAAIFALYLLVGIGSGFANIPMMSLVTYWFRSEQRGKAAGLVIGGNGAGIILAGMLVPFLNNLSGVEGWRSNWLVLGLICLVVATCAALFLRNHPEEMELEPIGRPLPPADGQLVKHEQRGSGMMLLRLGLLYLAFGATFMVYGTFIITTMVKEFGLSEAKAGFYWSWIGFISLFSGVFFGMLSDRIGRKWGLALVFVVQTAAYLLAGLKLGPSLLMVSIILYGLAVFAIPAIMAASVADYLGLARAAAAFATITIFFAMGQAVGPATAGIIAGASGSFRFAYLLSAAITAAAVVLAASLPLPPKGR